MPAAPAEVASVRKPICSMNVWFKVGGAEKLNFSNVSGLTTFGQLAVTIGGAGTTVSFAGNTVFLQGIFAFTASDCAF